MSIRVLLATCSNRGREKTDMKRQIVLGFSVALIGGAFLVMGACNKHGFEDDEFNTGTQTLFQAHGEAGHGDDHADGHDDKGAHGGEKGHHSDKDGNHEEKKSGGHDDGHKSNKTDGHASKKEHKAAAQPAKSLLPKK